MLGSKDAIGISLRAISVSFEIGSEAGRAGSIGRRTRGRLVLAGFRCDRSMAAFRAVFTGKDHRCNQG
jgi:hypothetical protein